LYVGEARAHALSNDVRAALDVLMRGVARVRADDRPLVLDELKRQLDSAVDVTLLDAYERLKGSAVPELVAIADLERPHVIEAALNLAERSVTSGKWDDVDRNLRVIETMPTAAVETPGRRSLLRLRGVWHRYYQRWADAINSFDAAMALGSDSLVLYEKGLPYFFRAQAVPGGAQTDYRQAASIASDLSRQRYYAADALVLDTNHRLRRDEDT